MPSLHFGYSLLIGFSIMQLPVAHHGRLHCLALPFKRGGHPLMIAARVPAIPKLICGVFGFLYPSTILVAIISTANHFILDAVVGGTICLVALKCNEFMLNFLPIEDYILWCLRIHKPVQQPINWSMHHDPVQRSS